MTHGASTLTPVLRWLALAAALGMSLSGFADDYGDVTQLLRSGKLAEGIARADRYLAARPRDPQMRFLKGVLQTESGRTADAIATFTDLTQEYPELPEPHNNLAVLYAGRGEFDKARAALETAVRTNPRYAAAHENLGDIYVELASQEYGRALQLEPGNASVRPKLALIRQLLPAGTKAAAPAAPASAASGTQPAARGS